ncbi:MAG: bifunctional nuclease family protein [Treponema sp.]|jgi:bifunctional DNase/RNase|nr:bifunctional nuclease family protein [Treponema sp.]
MRNKQSMKQAKIWTITPLDLDESTSTTLFLKLANIETLVPVFIDQSESQPILKVLHNRIPPNRPLVHGALLSLMKDVGFSLSGVEIYDIHDNILLARLLFEGQSYSAEKPLVSPVTPLDACVLATLAECPIYVAENVIEQIGVPVGIELDKFRI